MDMRFTRTEIEAIVKRHLVEKLGVSEEAFEGLTTDWRVLNKDGQLVLGTVHDIGVGVKTDKVTAIPNGPYRTSGR